jgi:hypothetical protein
VLVGRHDLNTEELRASMLRAGSWHCRPLSPKIGLGFALLLGAAAPVLISSLIEEDSGHYIQWIVLMSVALAGMLQASSYFFRTGFDCVYLGSQGFARVLIENSTRQTWVIRFSEIEDIYFKSEASLFSEPSISAEIVGDYHHTTVKKRSRLKKETPSTTSLKWESLSVHPRLLSTLIELAAPHARSRKRQRVLARARQQVERAERMAAPAMPVYGNHGPQPMQQTPQLLWL